MSKPAYNNKTDTLIVDITPNNENQADKITGIESKTQIESAMYSTEPDRWRPAWMPNRFRKDLSNADLKGANVRFTAIKNWPTAEIRGFYPNLSGAICSDGSLVTNKRSRFTGFPSRCMGEQLIPLGDF